MKPTRSNRIAGLIITALLITTAITVAWLCRNRPAAPSYTPSSTGNTPKTTETAPTPQRIVCASPAVTEWVFALGCGDRVIAVADYSNHPPQATQKPSIGGFINPDCERLLRLAPDLIITQGTSRKIATFAQTNNIPITRLQVSDLDTIDASIRQLGRTLDCPYTANQLCDTINQQLDTLGQQTSPLPDRSVFFCIGRQPGSLRNITTIGANSRFLNQLLEIAGGANTFAEVPQGYPTISQEALLKRRPQVIIEPHPGESIPPKRLNQLRDEWKPLQTIPAVANQQLFFPTEDYLMIPGPRLVQAARTLAQLIHPELEIAP